MSLACFLDSFNVTTGTAGTTIPRSGYGFSPKAFLIWTMGRTEATDAAGSSNAKISMGVGASSTARRAVGSYAQDVAAAAISGCSRATAAVLVEVVSATATAGKLDVSSIDAEGITFIIDVQFVTNLRVHVLAIGGTDVTAVDVGTFNTTNTTGNLDVTTGFPPDIVFFLSANNTANDDVVESDCVGGLGVAASSAQQAVVLSANNNTATNMNTTRYGYAGECYGSVAANVSSTTVRGTYVGTTGTGFTVNRLESGTNTSIIYLAIQGGAWAVGTLTTRTDGADIAVTGLAGQPVGLLFCSHGAPQSTQDTVDDHGMFSLGAATSPTARAAQGYSDQDALADAEIATFVEYDAVYVKSDLADGVDALMDLKSIGPTDFVTVMDDTEPTAGSMVVWVAGMNVTAPASPLGSGTHMMTGMGR